MEAKDAFLLLGSVGTLREAIDNRPFGERATSQVLYSGKIAAGPRAGLYGSEHDRYTLLPTVRSGNHFPPFRAQLFLSHCLHMKLGQQPKAVQTEKARQAQRDRQLQAALAKLNLSLETATGDEELPEEDPKEPQELEDVGDSEGSLEGTKSLSPFDQEWLEPLPLVSHLPRRARPPVLFRIDKHFTVHPLDRSEGWFSTLRSAIASAIARHLRESNTPLSTIGDWCNMPAIGSDEELLALVSPEHRENVKKQLHYRGGPLKAFAILLPNGDVITPQALIDLTQEGKHATRAGALRVATRRPKELAGEPWSSKDWTRFENAQSKAKKSWEAS